jgi:hypothetical protein
LASDAIKHLDQYCCSPCVPVEGVAIAQVWRGQKEIAGSWQRDKESGVSVFVNGTIIQPGITPRRIYAKEISELYLRNALAPEDYDGSFLIVIADSRSRQLMVINDRLGVLPCYYHATAGCFSFAPEAKAIFAALQMTPTFSVNGLMTFLSLGYCLSTTTLFESVHCLEPANRLVIDMRTASYEVTRYWRMQYQPAPALRSRRKAEEMLYESVLAGHRTVFAGEDRPYDLLLSGGWDSRGMLAAAHTLGHMPQCSISWGLRDDVPDSDPFLASQLATRYGVDHRFISYNTDTFIENAADWAYLTELNTDNYGWYAEGTGVLASHYAGSADFMLVGDEGWGFGNHVRNKAEAMAACHMPGVDSTALKACLRTETAEQYSGIYSAEVDKTLSTCRNDRLTDRKDYLYLHGRLARFIFSLGYYKELGTEIRRPFLCNDVLDVIQRLPARLRYNKNLYISMLLRFFPELLKVNECSASSLPNWRSDLRTKPELSSYFSDLLSVKSLSRASFGEYLNLPEIEAIAGRFFTAPVHREAVKTVRRRDHGRAFQAFKQRVAALDDIRLGLHLKKPHARQVDSFELLQRLALLSLLSQNLVRYSSLPQRRPNDVDTGRR